MPTGQGSYDDFIQLTDNEKLFLQDILTNDKTDEIIQRLQSIPYKSLLRLSENSSVIEKWCELPAMQAYWENLWATTAGRKPTPREAKLDAELTYRPLRPQSTISAFNLMRGVWLYDHANATAHKEPANPHIQPLLEKAAQLHCFEAIRAINRINMTKLYQGDISLTLEDIKNVISDLEKEIEFHGTPVLLLLALSYFEAGSLYAEEDVITSDRYFCLALMYVVLAEQVAELSVNAIHNAYYGLGLNESNSYGWGTFTKWREVILEQIEPGYRCVFESRAKKWADDFLAQQINQDELELVLNLDAIDQGTTSHTAVI
jgi:hypothetical protein